MLTLLALTSVSGAADLLVGPGQPYATVEAAVLAAAAGDRVLIDPGTYAEPTLVVPGIDLVVEAAAGPGTVFLDAASGRSLFEVTGGGYLTLVDLEVDARGERRFAEVTAGTLVVDGCTVGNTSTPVPGMPGGTIYAVDAQVLIQFSTLDGAVSLVKNGGHVRAVRSTVEIYSSSVFNGDAANGGAVSATDNSVITVEASHFDGNSGDYGGVVWVVDGDLQFLASNVSNTVSTTGTVLCSGGSKCTIDGTWFLGNAATTASMVQVLGTGVTTLTGNVLCGTTAGSSLVELVGTTATVSTSVFYDNALGSNTIRVAGDAAAEIVNNHFVSASATGGGTALLVEGSGTFVNNLVAHNAGGGPAVLAAGGALVERYNLYFDNVTADADVALDPTSLVGVDPLLGPLVAGSCDLAPLVPPAGSPAIDAGDPAILDDDGSVSDIGAYGNLSNLPPVVGLDTDGDGFATPDDCDDTDPYVNPAAAEIPCNGIDEDCDPATADDTDADADGISVCDGDCDDTNAERSELVQVYFDQDLDAYGTGELFEVCGKPVNSAFVDGDCDDTDPTINPGATEIPYDGIDQDCSGEDLDDLDGDGVRYRRDCDDQDPAVSPDALEIYDDGIDQDCDGSDATTELIGGAGVSCACASAGSGAGGAFVAPLLLLWLRRREVSVP